MRCLPQKTFWQKPQSPMMGCAAALQGGCAQRGLLDFRFAGVEGVVAASGVGVTVPDVVVVVVVVVVSADGTSRVAVISAVEASGGAVPPRRGERRCRVACCWRARSPTVLDGWRCLPACTRRESVGKAVEALRKLRTSEMVLQGRTLSGIAGGVMLAGFKVVVVRELWMGALLLPPEIATKIWMLSAGNDFCEVEDVAEEDRERMMVMGR